MKKIFIAIIAAALILALALTGCSGKSSYEAQTADAAYNMDYTIPAAAPAEPEAYAYDDYYEEPMAFEATGSAAEVGTNVIGNAPNRKIIKNADLSMETLTFEDFLKELDAHILACGGYIEASSVNGNTGNKKRLRIAEYTVRVPAQNLERFLELVGEKSNVTHKHIYTNDVTMSYMDIESRLTALRTEYDQLLKLLEKAELIEDIITLQERLSEVNYRIESYESQKRSYDDLITYSTVNIYLSEVERETPVVEETPSEEIARRFAESLSDVGEGLSEFGIGFVSNLPEILLWVTILAIPGGIVVLIITGKKRRATRAQKKAQKKAAKLAQKESSPEQ